MDVAVECSGVGWDGARGSTGRNMTLDSLLGQVWKGGACDIVTGFDKDTCWHCSWLSHWYGMVPAEL